MNYNQTTGILAFSTKENISFSVYPNPATNQFSVDAELSTETVIQILNYKGQLVKEVHQLNASNQIDISNLSSGIYFVNLRTNNTVSTQKLMVK